MIKKITGYYSILLGICIIGLWIMLLTTDTVPELETEPITIYFHLIAEVLMGILLCISGIGLFRKQSWGNLMFILSNGLVIYSVINSSGYYGNMDEWAMVMMFMGILVLSITFTAIIIKEVYRELATQDESRKEI
ncbi:hypothetical protein SAMN05660297_01634 [Natronincola peptidivorans]|uniref:DUF8058 domain-containing protein n=1 Tax=Natronincola peptidivorans TaxID=426128 RepID=A0A1I0CEW4_9FIRM|nr:hypothetical protein [Natronincola peptidivorans]SET18132.1 hypothetical protein SAMN05660297_01634 [Natronincola peptidivorans]